MDKSFLFVEVAYYWLGVSTMEIIKDDDGTTILASKAEGKLVHEPVMAFFGSHRRHYSLMSK